MYLTIRTKQRSEKSVRTTNTAGTNHYKQKGYSTKYFMREIRKSKKNTYRAPNGKMIDYREVMVDGELLPHTTRQFEIESFDKGKRYYFHKSTGGNKKLEGYPFHIQFSLLRYDIAITQ